MPNIPIEFAFGTYEHAAPSVENRRVLNCYPETTPGKSEKTVLRCIEGFEDSGEVDGQYQCDIQVKNNIYFVVRESGGQDKLYRALVSATTTPTITFLANLGVGVAGAATLIAASNGTNLVFVDYTTNNDYTYNIASTVVTDLNTVTNYRSNTRSVVYKDGYYLFMTSSILYHGDNSVTGGGTGIVFNALSFQTMPDADIKGSGGVGLAVANSQVYAITASKTFIYQTASTTPFSFARAINFDLDIGGVSSKAIIQSGERIFLAAIADGGKFGYYMIEGSRYELLLDRNAGSLSGPNLYSYRLNTHVFYGHTNLNLTDDETEIATTYDYTESKLRGYPVWHSRDFVEIADNNQLGYDYPIVSYFPLGGSVFAFSYSEDADATKLFRVNAGTVLNDPVDFGITQQVETNFEFSFPFVRSNGDPFFIKKVRLMFNENISTAELLRSTNGVDFASLGSINLSSTTSKAAEWRRIGRFETDVLFKIRFTPVVQTEPLIIIAGAFET